MVIEDQGMLRNHRTFEIYAGTQIVVYLILPALFAGVILDWWVAWLTSLSDPHAVIKMLLESSQGMLLRQQEVLGALLFVPTMVSIATLLRPHIRNGFIAVVALLMWMMFPFRNPSIAPLMALLLLCWTVQMPPTWQWLRWIPGVGLHLPHIAFAHRTMGFRSIWVGVFTSIWIVGLIWLDCLTSYDTIRTEMEAWPRELLDERVQVRAQVPGVRADWHGVVIHDQYAVVLAEETMRLMAFPLSGADPLIQPLGDRWGPERAAPLNLIYDSTEDLFWTLGNERQLHSFTLSETGWMPQKIINLPANISYAYLQLVQNRFALLPVQVKRDHQPPLFALIGDEPSWQQIRFVPTSGNMPMSYPREFTFIPEHNTIVLAPDFGTHLFTFDLTTRDVQPLVETPTLDGKMRWVPELDRLVVALPNRTELWVINIEDGIVDWTIPTQPGVRALAIDVKRKLVINASVVTGQILVQDLYSGEILDRLGTVMPMVREIALDPNSDQAILTTWAAVYQFPYTGGRE